MGVADLSRQAFIEKFGGVFEHSSWVAERAYDKGLASTCETAEGLHRALVAEVRAADDETKLKLLRAHPDLAGRLALAGEMTEDSKREQAGAGLDRLTPDELTRFTDLNRRYVEKFGFPFIIAVKGMDKDGILKVFEARVNASRHDEFANALAQVERIALMRLQSMMA